MKTIWLVRHGESTAQTEEEYGYDTGLSARGRKQAAALRTTLGDIIFDEIFISPLRRARETFEFSGLRTDNVKFDSRIIEVMPPELYRDVVPNVEVPKYGAAETENAWFEVPEARVRSFLKSLYGEDGGNILVISHSGCLGIMLNLFLGIGGQGFKSCAMDNGAISALSISDEWSEEKLLFWNRISHLQ